MKKTLIALATLAVLLAPAVFAQCEIVQAIDKVTTLIVAIAGALAVLALAVVGVMFFQAKDPSEKDQLKDRLKYIIIGLVVIVVAKPVVSYILGSMFTSCP